MHKTDTSQKSICVAAIKRSVSNPMGFMHTLLYAEGYAANLNAIILNEIILLPNELPVAATIFGNRWTLVTTQRVFTYSKEQLTEVDLNKISNRRYGLFKGSKYITEVIGSITDKQGNCIDFFMEAGAASLIMIRALDTLQALRIT